MTFKKPLQTAIMVSMLTAATVVAAQTGVSDDRVSLPEGPGSLEGVGDNTEMDPNMGSMTHTIPIPVPKGFNAVTPNLSLGYNSSGGPSVVGMGWSMGMPAIERMTYRKLPQYTHDDDFAYGGGGQLVRLPDTDPPVYRARFEKGFARHIWMASGDGSEGYWKVEYPDGSVGYFGADAQGNLVDEARESGAEGTFRYHMVEKVDVFGHRMKLVWQTFDGEETAYCARIEYVFTGGSDEATYAVSFEYEPRSDETGSNTISDATPGFELRTTQRLAAINILNRGVRSRSTELTYAPYDEANGFTRLASVRNLGAAGGLYPVQYTFDYAQGIGATCTGGCSDPYLVDMGTVGAVFTRGSATLLDINGDGLPDILDTTEDGPHRFFVNVPEADGGSHFVSGDEGISRSAVATRADFALENKGIQVLDVNGDGFTDLVNGATGNILANRGTGDWIDGDAATQGLAEAFSGEFSASEGEFAGFRFMDINNDRLIDIIKASRTGTSFLVNRGDAGFEDLGVNVNLGVGFAEDGLETADMNGDGLQDLVKIQIGSISTWLNHGWGKWGRRTDITGLPINDQVELERTQLEDINGDGLADLVVVQGQEIKYALNQNADSFNGPFTLRSQDIGEDLPSRESDTTVLFADMNANGSSDVVWIQRSGQIHYLELSPVRQGLMTKLTNGIGMVTDITYATSAQQMALDGGTDAWRYRLPFPMNVVSKIDKYDLLTELHEITEYRYHDGFYDGQEKQFRGFERVETRLISDDSQEEGTAMLRFDVGAEDPYMNGLMLSSATTSADRPLSKTQQTFADCPVFEPNNTPISNDTELPIRHICQTESQTLHQEGATESGWITTENHAEYDGYGQVVLSSQLGITRVGDGACTPCDRDEDAFGEACGAQCTGDESYTETSFITPGTNTSGRWLLGASSQVRTYGRPGSDLFTETLTYYDGNAFEGLPLGTIDQGTVTRVTEKIDKDTNDTLTAARNRYDAHGNVIEAIETLGSPDGNAHRRLYTYDDDALRSTRVELLLETPEGTPYRLRRTMSYEPLFDRIAAVSAWMRIEEGNVLSSPRTTSFGYDEFGRLAARFEAGNTSNVPDSIYSFELASPVSRVTTRSRSQARGALDIEMINCVDGRGRNIQTRTKIEDGLYQVTGFTEYNVRSAPVRVYQPYTSDSDQCDRSPSSALATSWRYDAMGRPLVSTLADASLHGTASTIRTVYGPMAATAFDQEDNDPDSPHANTPNTTFTNGLGQVVAMERALSQGSTPDRIEVTYDGIGNLTGVTDAGGNTKTQSYDLLGRVLRIVDPNSADVVTYEYDDASNITRSVDDRGVVTRFAYDGANRPIARWDDADEAGTRITWRYDHAPDCHNFGCTNTEGLVAETRYPGLDADTPIIEHYGFDDRGRAIKKNIRLAGIDFETTMAFDNADRATSMIQPNGHVFDLVYDQASRLIAVPGYVEGIDYDEKGLMATWRSGDGTETANGYDALMRPDLKTTVMADGEALQGFTYERDRTGNIMAINDLGPGLPAFGASYTYDAYYRVVSADLSGQGALDETLDFAFDALDNILSTTSTSGDESPAHTGTFGYDSFAPNAITSAGNRTMTYDAAGNMLTRGDQTMTWDFMNRLTRVERNGEAIAHFVYRSNQSRLAKIEGDSTTLYPTPDLEIRDGISTLYLRLGLQRIARIEDDALATALLGDPVEDGEVNAADAYIRHIETDTPSEPMLWSSVRRLLMETGPDDGTTFLHHDHQGSITLATGLVDGEPIVLGHRAFYPMGQERPGAQGYVDEYGFTGQEIDRSTGLIHFDWRYYDPTIGRWLSIDPAFSVAEANNIGEPGESTTAYAYVAGNFINSTDPTGLHIGDKIKSMIRKNPGKKGYKNKRRKRAKLKKSKTMSLFSKSTGGFENSATAAVDVLKVNADINASGSGVSGNLELVSVETNMSTGSYKGHSADLKLQGPSANLSGGLKVSKNKTHLGGSIGGQLATANGKTNIKLTRSKTLTLGGSIGAGFGGTAEAQSNYDPNTNMRNTTLDLEAGLLGDVGLHIGFQDRPDFARVPSASLSKTVNASNSDTALLLPD